MATSAGVVQAESHSVDSEPVGLNVAAVVGRIERQAISLTGTCVLHLGRKGRMAHGPCCLQRADHRVGVSYGSGAYVR